jgi:tRNA 2-thiouridine synthesizing protein A
MPTRIRLTHHDDAWHLDCLGLLCPVPIVHAGVAMKSLAAGDVLRIECDDPGAELDLEDWAEANGHPWEGAERDGDWSRCTVRKGRR